MLKLKRPLAFIDIEATGTDPALDRIVTLGITFMDPNAGNTLGPRSILVPCNPMREMSDEVIAIHGITNEMAAKFPPFEKNAKGIYEHLTGCDLAGFNHTNFDIPILWEEFYRCGIKWDLTGVRIIDIGNIFKKKEERSLSAAVQFYLNRAIQGAHDAVQDATETMNVFGAQLARYPDLAKMDLDQLHRFSRLDEDVIRVDLRGHIVQKLVDGKLLDPEFTFRKVKGVRVVDDVGFAMWVLRNDFPENTKMHIRRILGYDEVEAERKQDIIWNEACTPTPDAEDLIGKPQPKKK